MGVIRNDLYQLGFVKLEVSGKTRRYIRSFGGAPEALCIGWHAHRVAMGVDRQITTPIATL